MTTKLIKASEGIKQAAELIKNGELVVFPTETVYGLGADAFNPDAVAKIFEAKGRPQDNPLIVHISDIEQVQDIACDIPATFYVIATRFMPGPISVILKKNEKVPSIVTAGGDTVAVRMPENVYARELISSSAPLAAPSANRSKHVSPTTAQHVYDDLCGRVPLILDGGSCQIGIESTVLDLTVNPPAILRPGAITAEMLMDIFGELGEIRTLRIAKSPGMKYKHYAPVVPLILADGVDSAIQEYDRAERDGLRAVLVFRDIYRDKTQERAVIDLGITADDYARNIYATLRLAETQYDEIIVESLKGGGIAASVMNRVVKAAANEEKP